MAFSSVSDMSPASKRTRKFDSKVAMNRYHQYSFSVDELHHDMLYAMDTVERGRGILTVSPQCQPFTKCMEVLVVRLGVVRMIQDGSTNFEIIRGIAPEGYIKFMESVGVQHVSTMAALRETVLTLLECTSMEQLDSTTRYLSLRLSNVQKIIQPTMKTAELIHHMAVGEGILIPPHLAVLQPRPHAAAPPPVFMVATPGAAAPEATVGS